jgi:dinuclear metal center YbgI/SA1388 family protein
MKRTATTVADVTGWLESWIPPDLAEEWDNVGLLLGDPALPVSLVMTTLDVTPAVADEAIASGAQLIVSHHPILFRGTNRLTGDRSDPHAHVWRLARAGIAVYSPHTAYDSARGGINDQLADRLELQHRQPIQPGPARSRSKLVVFVPESDREPVLKAAFEAGGGVIGHYSECSFGTPGQGTFRGDATTHPTVGQSQRRETVPEWKLEIVCEQHLLNPVVRAIRAAHSYEEPAVDIIPLALVPGGDQAGRGRIGRLVSPTTLRALAQRIAQTLDAPGTTWAGPSPDRPVECLAIACGAGDSFLTHAARAGADALLTGEARYHACLEAESRGLGLILAGHHPTEWVGVLGLRDRIAKQFPQIDVRATNAQTPGVQPLQSPQITPVQ